MEDSNRYEISLNSGLDISSSDMLVPADSPKFQHNRQKYQGHYLPSSVRFEKDGWAAGNDVYQFDVTEASIEAGSFIVSKQNIFNNPTYKLIFKDKDNQQVGSVYYNSRNNIISADTAATEVDGGVNGHIRGKINGKDFTIDIDSVNGSVSLGQSDSNVVLVSADLKSDYTFEVQLMDESATIHADFAGMQLPTETIQNGDYILGQFSICSKNVSTWQNVNYTFKVSESNGSYYLSIYYNDSLVKGSIPVSVDSDAFAHASFTMPLTFSNTPVVSLQEFFPFFSGVAAGNLSKTVQTQASDSLRINTWSVSIEDRDNNGRYNDDKLYRNIRTGHDAFDGKFNKQTITQTVPLWFGISVRPGFEKSTEGLSVIRDAGSYIGEYHKDLHIAVKSPSTLQLGGINKERDIVFRWYTTDKVKQYSGAVYMPIVNIWENVDDVAEKYVTKDNSIRPVSLEVTYSYYYWKWVPNSNADSHSSPSESGELVKETKQGTFDITLYTSYDDLGAINGDIDNMFKVSFEDSEDEQYSTKPWVSSVTLKSMVSEDVTYIYRLSGSRFCAPNNAGFALNVRNGYAKIVATPSLVGAVGSVGSNAAYLDRLDTSASGIACWGRCCLVKVSSSLYIKSDSPLTNMLDASYFGVEEAATNASGYIDAGDIFKHKIVQATCSGSLSMFVYLCSKGLTQYMFYTTEAPQQDSTTYYLPGHIIYGDKKYINDSETGKMSCYAVAKTYDVGTVDSDYGLTVTVTAGVVKAPDESYYSYITDITDSIDISRLMPGNKFSGQSVNELLQCLSWNISPFDGYIDISENSKNDIDYMKGFKQDISLQLLDVSDSSKVKGEILTEYALTGKKLPLSGELPFVDSDKEPYPVTVGPVSLLGSYDPDTQKEINNMSIAMSTSAKYDIAFYIPKLYDASWELESLQNNIAVVYNSRYRVTLNFNSLQAKLQEKVEGEWGPSQECDEDWYDVALYKVALTSEYTRSIDFVACGVYNKSNVTVNRLTASSMNVTVDGETFEVNLAMLINSKNASKVEYRYTRVNQPELSETLFAQVDSDNELQFLKQQWDTTNETENFWWVDSSHILALTKCCLILRQNTNEVTDWDGDRFEDKMTWGRSSYISSSVLKYFCTSAYNGQHARFITAQNNNNSVQLNIYDPVDNMSQLTFSLQLQKRTIGTELCPDSKKLYTYSDISLSNMITQAKWSATCIDCYCIVGIHFDNNFNQWAVVIDLENNIIVNIIQGYGFVGVNGSLTGGEIPAKYFNAEKGFTGTVQPLSVLSDKSYNITSLSQLSNVSDMIVGSDAQQWYISKSIPAIVSHLEYSNGVFYIRQLPLNNNYSVAYDSASYMSTVFSDYKLNVKPLKDLLPESNSAWTAMLVLWTYPMLYFLAPKISVANYLQQTLGQAAYVHYNSTSIRQQKDAIKESITKNYSKEEADEAFDNEKERSPLMSDELSFDRQSVKQTQSTSDPYTTMFTMCAAALVSALDWGQETLQVNKFQNQSATSDLGRKYTQHFIQNLNSMAIANMSVNAVNPSLTSEVTAIKTLDMFYSTSDKQEISAGPGWVNHNFVAQCVSQSVTSVQSEFMQQKLLYIISALTMLPIQQLNRSLESARAGCQAQIDANGGQSWFIGGLASGGTVGAPAVIALGVGYVALDIACNITRIGLEVLPTMLEALGGNKLNSSIAAQQSKHNYEIEGKHKYGEKSECFMWPCFGITSAQSIMDESVEAVTQNKSWKLSMSTKSPRDAIDSSQPSFVTDTVPDSVKKNFNGNIPYYIAMIKGKQSKVTLPNKMAYVIGTEAFLPLNDFKNENIGESEPVFVTAPFQDYIIDDYWQLGHTASVGLTTWVSCKDTKIIDGELSNCVISKEFCGVASPYTAIEVKRGIQKKYLRPWAITPQVIALNNTGLNCCFEEKAYHAFDGYGYRTINWCGAPGMGKSYSTDQYAFLVNDRFKRSNKLPSNTFLGNFKSDPVMDIPGDINDRPFVLVTQAANGVGLDTGTVGEDKDTVRIALPVFSEFVNTLPAAVKTIAVQVLGVIDGITSLTTENRDLQSAYKAPVSVDFTIGKNKYRYTQEYICSITQQKGVTLTEELVPCLGLDFIGSTPYEAYLYSQATRQYYAYTGGSSLRMVSMIERFRDVANGVYDFVNQEVLMSCLATFARLDKNVADDTDETDNIIIPRLKDNEFKGEVCPPSSTIFNTRSWFKIVSLPCGIAFQGPNRCVINRFVLQDYMVGQIKKNYGLWKRVPRESYHPFRTYKASYEYVDEQIGSNVKVNGWTHNPFLLVTSPIGVKEDIDNLYEWEITFCWPVEMDRLYNSDSYATVNIQAETMTPGGKVVADRPTHVFLTKELFTTTGNYGYYSFRYQSKCGAGNRERLHIWSDQYICVSSLKVDIKQITNKRTEQLTQQVDIQRLKEV